MRLHRFYIGGLKAKNEGKKGAANARPALSELDISSRITLDSGISDNDNSIIHQWRDVFRYTAGSRVVLFDDSKTECLCMIESLTMTKADLVIVEKSGIAHDAKSQVKKASKKSKKDAGLVLPGTDLSGMGKVIDMGVLGSMGEPLVASEGGSREIWLLASIVKNDNFDLIIQKTTELGVDHIVPVISDRTIKKDINMKRASRIAIEASEQSGRMSVPTVHEPIALKKAIEHLMSKGGEAVVCTQHGKNWGDIKPFLKKYPLGFVIGPEGGWSEREEAYFKTSGFKMVKIGENVLRAETAAIATVTLIKIK